MKTLPQVQIRIGYGFDVHQLREGVELSIGGIKIPHTKGTLGHSDGDVLIHAICDALFGAANMRDIGYHFPDTSSEYEGIDSKILLKRTLEIISEKGFSIGNIDTTICIQKPKMSPYIEQMKYVLSEVLGISSDDISIKAKTMEKLGFVGEELGVTAHATVLLFKNI